MTNPSDDAIAKTRKKHSRAVKSAIDQAKKTGKPITTSEEMLKKEVFSKN
jgi:hypothetical protein